MKKLLLALLISAGISGAVHAQNENTTVTIGMKAPELKFPSPDGNEISLTEITKGRIVLVDFWASWCRPCRNANPRLVALYKKYSTQKFKDAKKGFTIFSVSLDQKKDAWVKAIAADSLVWPCHISDLGGWASKPAEVYGVQFIPQAFLVGSDGKIIGTYQFAEQAEEDLKKLLK